MAKLKDIAEELHLSTSTISRVVNNQDRVDPDTRKRVLEALKRQNYQPDENARRLKTNTSNVIGVIVPDISNLFYATVFKGIERGVMDRHFSVLLCNTDENTQKEQDAIYLLMRQKVAGIIVATSIRQRSISRIYRQIDCPVVFFDNIPQEQDLVNTVSIDNIRASRDMVRYMIERGHRRIYMIAGPAGESSADGRLEGWRQALQHAGIEPEPDWCRYGDFRESSGRSIMMEFLQKQLKPTAICAANNLMAYGAVKAIEKDGLSIPGDISVGTFDAVDMTGLMRLSLTTVIQPAESIGLVAANLCMSSLKRESVAMSQKVILDHVFLPNDTVSCIAPDNVDYVVKAGH